MISGSARRYCSLNVALSNVDGKRASDLAGPEVEPLLLHVESHALVSQQISQSHNIIESQFLQRPENLLAVGHLSSVFVIRAAMRGTAFVLKVDTEPNRVLVTCSHVIEGASAVSVENESFGKLSIDASTFRYSPNPDIDIAWAPWPHGHTTAFTLSKVQPRLGQLMHVLGYPLDYEDPRAVYSSCTLGGVRMRGKGECYIVTGGGINHGNSGGPMFVLKSGEDNHNCVLGLVRGAPKRFIGEHERSLSQLLLSADPDHRCAGQLLKETSYVGITEIVSAREIEVFLQQTQSHPAGPVL